MTQRLQGLWFDADGEVENVLEAWRHAIQSAPQMGGESPTGLLYRNLREGSRFIALHYSPPPGTGPQLPDAFKISICNDYELVQVISPADVAPERYLMIVRNGTEPDHDAEMDLWYEQEHLGALATVEGCSGARRYRATLGEPRYLAVYELTSPDVAGGPAWRQAADTPWTQRMRPLFKNVQVDLGQLIGRID